MSTSKIADVAIAVFHGDDIQTAYCSLAGQALNADSVFEAASLSKPVFAAGVLTLVQQHRLDLDKPLSQYMPHPYVHAQHPFTAGATDVVNDPRLQRITARMVLSHTAGLPNWSWNGPLTFISNPGEKWSYSGEGYVYLQRVVETITGEPLEVFLKRTILVPLGMTHSSFVWQPGLGSHLMSANDAKGMSEPEQQFTGALASTTLYTTLNDYARFVSKLLKPATNSPFALEENRQVEVRSDLALGWGLGLAVEGTSPPSYFHWASNPGYQSFFLVQPATSRAVLFFTNSDSGLDLVDAAVNLAVPGKHPSLQFPMLHPKD
jgi:CubicO group peptidase (beta-lactamase class C family)